MKTCQKEINILPDNSADQQGINNIIHESSDDLQTVYLLTYWHHHPLSSQVWHHFTAQMMSSSVVSGTKTMSRQKESKRSVSLTCWVVLTNRSTVRCDDTVRWMYTVKVCSPERQHDVKNMFRKSWVDLVVLRKKSNYIFTSGDSGDLTCYATLTF